MTGGTWQGHFIAYRHLTDDSARTRANALIKENPFFKRWLTMIPTGTGDKHERRGDMMLFMNAGMFSDQIRSDNCYEEDVLPV
jgi:hypothetical protein